MPASRLAASFLARHLNDAVGVVPIVADSHADTLDLRWNPDLLQARYRVVTQLADAFEDPLDRLVFEVVAPQLQLAQILDHIENEEYRVRQQSGQQRGQERSGFGGVKRNHEDESQ